MNPIESELRQRLMQLSVAQDQISAILLGALSQAEGKTLLESLHPRIVRALESPDGDAPRALLATLDQRETLLITLLACHAMSELSISALRARLIEPGD